MYIGSGLNTVSSLYGQQKGNQMKTPASGEKTFYMAETPKVYQIFIPAGEQHTIPLALVADVRQTTLPKVGHTLQQFSRKTRTFTTQLVRHKFI